MKINLTIRMKMNASLIPEGSRVADIGTDHGYVAMWLAKEKKCPLVIATDVNEGPLKHAVKNIKDAGLENKIDTRLGNGLEVIDPDEIDTVLIAGMGGMTICEILSSSYEKLDKIETLILQPQSDLEEVRRHLHKVGYRIDRELICMEDGKYYFSIRAVRGSEEVPYTDSEYRFSRLLAEEGGSVFRGYMRMMTDKLSDLLNTLETPGLELGERAGKRKVELESELQQLKESFS